MSKATGARPRNVAIIMDGNGRWAQRRGLPRTVGHHRGVDRAREIIRVAPDLGVETLTLYAFSTENWRRPAYEVSVLMTLFRRYIKREAAELDMEGVQVRFIGRREGLPKDLQTLMGELEERTATNTRLRLQLALNYGARGEITEGVKSIARAAAEGRLDPESVTDETISAALQTAGTPDPDLMIRTSGEYRMSNFLLWQIAYSELVFVDECWPDFDGALFGRILDTCSTRERRFGGVHAVGFA